MGKKDDSNALDKKRSKRLKKLSSDWPESCWPEKLTLPDLRLLLEHFAPLQDLIRAIAAVSEGDVPRALAQETTDMREPLEAEEAARRDAEAEFERVRSDLERVCNECRKYLEKCSATTTQLLQKVQDLETQLNQAQTDLHDCQVQLARCVAPPAELTMLREDAELARHLGLAELPDDDQQALIRMVAVLAQRDNLERLWSALRDLCETRNRPASEAELALLNAALAWYNHNWRDLPYRLVEAAPRTAYNYERHLRARQTPIGETVAALWLPGIADGSGKPVCKALVSTH